MQAAQLLASNMSPAHSATSLQQPRAGPGAALRPAAAQRQLAGAALQPSQQQQAPQRRAAARRQPRTRRHVAVSVAAPLAAVGPHASEEYSHEVHAAVDAVRLASRLCQASRTHGRRGCQGAAVNLV